MTQSNIIQILCDTVDCKRIANNEDYQKNLDEAVKCNEILVNFAGDNKEIQETIYQYSVAQGQLEGIASDMYFREGFLCGARLALEICGFERVEKKND